MRRVCLITLLALAVTGCLHEEASVPAEFHGLYTTSRDGYEDCLLQIGDDTIAWKDAEGNFTTHRVVRVSQATENGKTEWTLQHELEDGERGSFSFRYTNNRIYPVHQRRFIWYRKTSR